MIVLDASAAVELLLTTPTGTRVAARIAPRSEALYAPSLLDVEVAQVLRRLVHCGQVSDAEAREALDVLLAFDIERMAHEPLIPRVWSLRHNLTAYDACYVALAEALGAVLLTCNGKLASAAEHQAQIMVC